VAQKGGGGGGASRGKRGGGGGASQRRASASSSSSSSSSSSKASSPKKTAGGKAAAEKAAAAAEVVALNALENMTEELAEMHCGEDCINRMLMIECTDSSCDLGALCRNRQFKRRMVAKTQVFRQFLQGWGLRLDEDVSEGDFICEYMGEIIE
jgi:histone-lysine N-methyltransferase SETD2